VIIFGIYYIRIFHTEEVSLDDGFVCGIIKCQSFLAASGLDE